MFERVSSFIQKEKGSKLDAQDIRHFIQEYLRNTTGQEAIYCQKVSKKTITIRVANPLIYQEVCIREYDLRRVLAREANFVMSNMKVLV